MRMCLFTRMFVAALAVVGTSLLPVATSSSEAGAGAPQLFTGGGYGPTPALAVQAAIEDAEASASAGQLNTCELVGQPVVFGPRRTAKGLTFTAEATVSCTP